MNQHRLGLTLGLICGLASTAAAAQTTITISSAGGTVAEGLRTAEWGPAAAKLGYVVREETTSDGLAALKLQVQSGSVTSDIVHLGSGEGASAGKDGLLTPIDYAVIDAKSVPDGAAAKYCFPFDSYGTVLAWNTATYGANGPKSWADFWDVKKFPGKRAMRQGPKTNLEIALMADGVAPADVYKVLATPEGVDRAFRKLDELKPNLIWWTAGAQPPQMLAAGDVAMTTAYNGRIAAANTADKKDFKIVWTGSLFTIDSWVILKGSPNVDAATKFLAYMGKPENQAKLPTKITYGVTNKAATPLIAAEYLPGLPTNPANMSQAVELNAEFWLENIDSLTERFNTWAAK